jgi:hypothetical protein
VQARLNLITGGHDDQLMRVIYPDPATVRHHRAILQMLGISVFRNSR